MDKLTLALITKNEAANLAACLDSAKPLACPIVIIDSGSTDDTPAIAERYGAQFHVFPDWPGFGPQRNRAHPHIHTDWVLWLDADERLTPELCRSIQAAVAATPADGRTAFAFNRLSNTFGKFIRHSGWYPDWVVRLYPAAHARYSDDLIHEKVLLPANCRTGKLSGDCLHYTYATLDQFLQKQNLYSTAWAEQRRLHMKRTGLAAAFLHGTAAFVKMYLLKAGFLDGRHGLLLAALSAQSAFNKYAALWLAANTPPEQDK
ncbi:TPA: glycosyltransferase family 2 protein [Neisseria bacilliformis]|uniref:glycosyltransferase family 2 protein n=1 Tax=Neisseria bacilliformis TaxID=267212 RepID=UPI0028E4A16A|nr:glycosyltransferase family 2 protein [Neisseria bacilliformis]